MSTGGPVAHEFVIPGDPEEGEPDRVLLVSPLDPIAYAALVDGHPPDRSDPPGLGWSQQTFPPALIAACTGADVADADRAWRTWPADVVESLLELCLELCSPGSIDWALRRLDDDARLALELEYCAPRGVAHDVFLGWARRSQDLALAWTVRRADRCPGCGVPTADMDDPLAAEVDLRRCETCGHRKQVTGSVPEDERDTIHAFVRRIPPHQRGAD